MTTSSNAPLASENNTASFITGKPPAAAAVLWATESGLLLGQRKVRDKRIEIIKLALQKVRRAGKLIENSARPAQPVRVNSFHHPS